MLGQSQAAAELGLYQSPLNEALEPKYLVAIFREK